MIALKMMQPTLCFQGLASSLPGLGGQVWSMRFRLSLSVPMLRTDRKGFVPGKPLLDY